MSISVVIPAHNEEKYLPACLESILTYRTPDVAEVIVVDNCSTDKTADVAGRFSGVRVVSEPQKGLTRARQRGFTEATGELLACIDADTRVRPGWFEIVTREFASDSKLVCLSGPFDYYDLPPGKRALTNFFQIFLYPLVSRVTGYLVQGGNFVAKRSALVEIGGFDCSIDFYGEDTDIAVRLHRVGKVRYAKNFFILASGRRLLSEGALSTGLRYSINFIWETVFNRPYTKTHKDIR